MKSGIQGKRRVKQNQRMDAFLNAMRISRPQTSVIIRPGDSIRKYTGQTPHPHTPTWP